MRRALFLCLILTPFVSRASFLDAKSDDPWYLKIAQETTSPFITNARYLFAGGALVTTGFFAHKRNNNYDFIQSEYGEDKSQGTYSKIGDYGGQLVPNALYSLGMLSYGWISDDSKSIKRASYMFRATLYPALASTLLKVAFEEKRPGGGKYSFPSGHTTTAFAFATAVACEHEWYYSVPAFGLAAFVGLSRMNDSKHYFHDVLAGATIGSSYALGIYLLDRNRDESKKDSMSFLPIFTTDFAGISIDTVWD